MPQVVGIHHVAIAVADLDAARAFYGGVLGFEELDRPDFGVPGAWFQVGGQQLHLGELAGHEPPRFQHFALQVADLDGVVAHVESHGIAVRRLPQVEGAGRQAVLRDPSGNAVELNQPDRR